MSDTKIIDGKAIAADLRSETSIKVEDFNDKGFRNIVLVGHSAGAWSSLVLKSEIPNQINGVIAEVTF